MFTVDVKQQYNKRRVLAAQRLSDTDSTLIQRHEVVLMLSQPSVLYVVCHLDYIIISCEYFEI